MTTTKFFLDQYKRLRDYPNVRIILTMSLSFLLFLSNAFGNTDLRNLTVSFHITSHLHDSNDHGHHHTKHSHKSKTISHHHHKNDDSPESGEPHEHSFTFSAPFVSFLTPSYELALPNIDTIEPSTIPINLLIDDPFPQGLFRPPIT